MSTLVWIKDYCVGIPAIDNEHKLLISLMNDLNRVLDTHKEFQEQIIGDTLNTLEQCIRSHFESEENFLLTNSYPEFNDHKAEHTLLLEKLEHFEKRFKSEKPLFTENMLRYLKDWLVRHIILHDIKYGIYFRDNGQIEHFG
jgi:hemerythrin-like metal-binding protein